jgi:hypothetical protein
VDASGLVELFDVLLLVNDLRVNGGPHALPPVTNPPPPPPFLDVNGNGLVELNDVLRVIHRLLVQSGEIPEGEAAQTENETPFVPLTTPRDSQSGPSGARSDERSAQESAAPPIVKRAATGAPPAAISHSLTLSAADSTQDDVFESALDDIAADVCVAWGNE